METPGIFDTTFSTLEKNLDVRSKKHNLIVSNVSNMDTPHYRPFDFVVEEAMSRVLSDQNNVRLSTTNKGHLAQSPNGADSYLNEKTLNITQKDEEVNIDKTMSDLAQNSIIYNASAQILSKKLAMIKNAISGGSR